MAIEIKAEDGKVPAQPDKAVHFRDDLREPKVVFGRCCITGEWGKCVTIDLGDIAVDAPDTSRGVEYDPESGEVKFNVWKPAIFNNQATFSEKGLEILLDYSRSQENPIPAVTPVLVYQWRVTYTDGSGLSQFQAGEAGQEIEVNSAEIERDRVAQVSVLPREVSEDVLPTFTFVLETGKFYKAGVEIDPEYPEAYPEQATYFYARKVTHTWGSIMQQDSLNRSIDTAHTTVLQLLGWEAGDKHCIIAIDDRGNWRPWRYN